MKHKAIFLLSFLLALCAASTSAQERTSILLNFGWKFLLLEQSSPNVTGVMDDTDWRTVNLPHDYQMELPWDPRGVPARGFKGFNDAVYQKHFRALDAWKGRKVLLDFEGIMTSAVVWLNGHKLGEINYGYLGAEFDISQHLKYDADNVITVLSILADGGNSRWYTGGGIFRNVHIYTKNPISVTRHGLYITTPTITEREAAVQLQVEIEGARAQRFDMTLEGKIYGPDGTLVAQGSCEVPKYIKLAINEVKMPLLTVAHPQLWSCETPNLYRAEVVLKKEGETIDRVEDLFGIRTIEFTKEEGFKLNGKKVFLRGIANHHDLGAVGAASFPDAEERLMLRLKEFGYNHIRTSHNPYSESFLRLADKHGILIVDELFDKWQLGGPNWVANLPFDQLWYQVEAEWIHRDRNHPSVILWSFGNELQVNEGWAGLPTGDWGVTTYRLMKVLAERYDPTRLTTVAMFPARANAIRNDPEWEGNFTPPELSCVTDIAAYNYQYPAYKGYLEHNPDLIIYQSEATVNDLLGPWEGMDREKMVGLAYWGAIEYWGESNGWPKKGWNYSFFNHNLDPYPQAWLIRSAMTQEPICCIGVQDGQGEEMMWNDNLVGTTFISSHWNRKADSRHNVYVFTNADEAELLINGRSLGVKRNDGQGKGKNRMLWTDVPYGTGGTILAIARTGGKEVARHELKTTGKAVRLVIEAEDNGTFTPDGMSLRYVHVYAVDAKGNRVPTAADEVTLDVQGAATIQAIDDGNHYTDELMNVNPKHLYKGQLLLILRSTQQPGTVTVKASSPALKAANYKFSSQ